MNCRMQKNMQRPGISSYKSNANMCNLSFNYKRFVSNVGSESTKSTNKVDIFLSFH